MPVAATLQRKSSGEINFVIISKIITKENVPRNSDIFETPVTVTPQQEISKTLNSSKIPFKILNVYLWGTSVYFWEMLNVYFRGTSVYFWG